MKPYFMKYEMFDDNIWEICTFLECNDLLNVSLSSKSIYQMLHKLLIPSRFIYKFENEITMVEDKHVNGVISSFISSNDQVFQKYLIDNAEQILRKTNNITLIEILAEGINEELEGILYECSIAYKRYFDLYNDSPLDCDNDYTALYYNLNILLETDDHNIIHTILFLIKALEQEGINYILDNIYRLGSNIILMIIIIELSIIDRSWYCHGIPLHEYLTEMILTDGGNVIEKYHFILRYLLDLTIQFGIDIPTDRLQELLEYNALICSTKIEYPTKSYEYYLYQALGYDGTIEDINDLCILIMNGMHIDYASKLLIPKSLGLRFHDIISMISLALNRAYSRDTRLYICFNE